MFSRSAIQQRAPLLLVILSRAAINLDKMVRTLRGKGNIISMIMESLLLLKQIYEQFNKDNYLRLNSCHLVARIYNIARSTRAQWLLMSVKTCNCT